MTTSGDFPSLPSAFLPVSTPSMIQLPFSPMVTDVPSFPSFPSCPTAFFPVSTPLTNQLPLSPMVTVGGTASLPSEPSFPSRPRAETPVSSFPMNQCPLSPICGTWPFSPLAPVRKRQKSCTVLFPAGHLFPGLCGSSTLPSTIMSFHCSKALWPSLPSFPSFPLRYLKKSATPVWSFGQSIVPSATFSIQNS